MYGRQIFDINCRVMSKLYPTHSYIFSQKFDRFCDLDAYLIEKTLSILAFRNLEGDEAEEERDSPEQEHGHELRRERVRRRHGRSLRVRTLGAVAETEIGKITLNVT